MTEVTALACRDLNQTGRMCLRRKVETSQVLRQFDHLLHLPRQPRVLLVFDRVRPGDLRWDFADVACRLWARSAVEIYSRWLGGMLVGRVRVMPPSHIAASCRLVCRPSRRTRRSTSCVHLIEKDRVDGIRDRGACPGAVSAGLGMRRCFSVETGRCLRLLCS
jgi:hypothetical protein